MPHCAASLEDKTKGKLLYLVTEDWYFCSHRLPLARVARDAGFEVVVATRVAKHEQQILEAGLRVVPINMHRRGRSVFHEVATLWQLIKLYRSERPVLVHQVALKPVIYGSIAAWFTRVPIVINALAGLGYVYSSSTWSARLIRPLVTRVLSMLLRGRRVRSIVQNSDDFQILRDLGVSFRQITMIRGSGVDTCAYCISPEPNIGPTDQVVVTIVSRMLWDKGLGELIECVRILRRWKVPVTFWLVGAPDPENPTSIHESVLQKWHDEGIVKWLGQRDDVSSIWAQSHIAVLPSYREGLPKSLLEASACGRAIVATDVPGCREIVHDEENGLLVAVKNPHELAIAISRLVREPLLRSRMGRRGREIVLKEFSEEHVTEQFLFLYLSTVASP